MTISPTRQNTLLFLLGCSFGVFVALIARELHVSNVSNKSCPPCRCHTLQIEEDDYTLMLLGSKYDSKKNPKLPIYSGKLRPVVFNDLDVLHQKGGDTVAKILSQSVRVLCWVMTQPLNFLKAQAVNNTWGKRCNVLLFMSTEENGKLPVVILDVPEGRNYLWRKTRGAWKYVYENHFNDADWFIKADDDTFIIVENLRYFLSKYNTTDPYYFGRHFTPYGGYNSGGAGYVFSKETLTRFNKAMEDPFQCKLDASDEDVEAGTCLHTVGVDAGDTRDELGRETFHPFPPEYHLVPGMIEEKEWIHQYSKYPVSNGLDCCSDHSISFHYVTQERMYLFEYLIYHLHPYGVNHLHD